MFRFPMTRYASSSTLREQLDKVSEECRELLDQIDKSGADACRIEGFLDTKLARMAILAELMDVITASETLLRVLIRERDDEAVDTAYVTHIQKLQQRGDWL